MFYKAMCWYFFKVMCWIFVSDDSLLGEAGHREHATALMMASRHLPSHVASDDEKQVMLTEAALSYERIGDRKSLQSCRALLTRLNNNSGTGCATVNSASVVTSPLAVS